MPAWLKILINLIGYGGFIAIATHDRSPSEKAAGARPARRPGNRPTNCSGCPGK